MNPSRQLVLRHPLAPILPEEVTAVRNALEHEGLLEAPALLAYLGLEEPGRFDEEELGRVDGDVSERFDGEASGRYDDQGLGRDDDQGPGRGGFSGKQLGRALRAVVVPGPEAVVVEAVVELPSGRLRSTRRVDGARPALSMEESLLAIAALQADPRWREAMHRRGVDDVDRVQIDPWPAGTFGEPYEAGRRLCRCLAYVRHDSRDNGYAHPVEGVVAIVDMGRAEVLEVIDDALVAVPEEPGRFGSARQEPDRPPLAPLVISQPEGPGFSVDDGLVRWGPWSLRVTVDPIEGLVLHQVAYDDHGRHRRILRRASICEMAVPYGDPSTGQFFKCAFDAGEWGLGRLANSLTLGCDCLGEIRYLDAVFSSEHGEPYTVKQAVCLHEEDYGILWKHTDLHHGCSDVRRSRRLVVSSFATVGNYDYGFFWYLYLDGTIAHEVKLTGILSTMAVARDDGEELCHSTLVAPRLAAPFHQHLFSARLHFDLDGAPASVVEVDAVPAEPGPKNPWGSAFVAATTVLRSESEARRDADAGRSRTWRVLSATSRNRLGQPAAYELRPQSTPRLLASPESSVGRRAGFAAHHLWVTAYHPDERRAAGEYPNQSSGEDGLPRYSAADRSLLGADVVLWHTFGVTHLPRPEDWPVMPVAYAGFHLLPVGFFDADPALDLAPSAVCHASG